MKKYLVEFIGTFFLVLAIGMNVVDPSTVVPPLAIGLALMVVVYAGGHVSGAHYNPAVTIAVWLRGRCAAADVVPYIISQLLGSAIASFAVLHFKGHGGTPQELNTVNAVVADLLGTFAPAYFILNAPPAKATAGNSFYGLAIGLTVTAMAFIFGGVSGGVFNPA